MSTIPNSIIQTLKAQFEYTTIKDKSGDKFYVICDGKYIGDQRAALRPWSCDRITFSIKSSHRHHPHIPTSTRATSTKENNVSKNTFVLRPCTARPHCQIVRSGSTSNNIVTELHLEKTLKKSEILQILRLAIRIHLFQIHLLSYSMSVWYGVLADIIPSLSFTHWPSVYTHFE